MLAAIMLAGLAATSILLAASLRLAGLGPTLLAAYIALVSETVLLTLILSPTQSVRRGPLAATEAAILVAAAALWWRRGRPGRTPLDAVTPALKVFRDPVVAVFATLVVIALAYELLLVLAVPANNWDSLTYHLARVAAWIQHGGLYWIPNAPTDRMNEFQPAAEQEIFFLFAATGKGALFALPQYIAEFALLVGIYTAARRIGFEARGALLSALLFASFTLVALEATTSQNDLVAASLPLAAAAFLLGGSKTEAALAGVALGLGLGVKLTTALVLPVVAILAIRLGRRCALGFGLAAGTTFAALSSWSFILNVVETGHVLGRGGGRVEQTTSPSFPGSLSTAGRVVLRLFDLSGFNARLVGGLLIAATILAPGVVIVLRSRGIARREAWSTAGICALPLLAPTVLVELGLLDEVNSRVDEDLSSFGPLGVVLIGASVVPIVAMRWRRPNPPRLILALVLPTFLVILALTSKYNPWLARFLIVPAALTAPLFAPVFRRRSATLTLVAVAATTLALALVRNDLKPSDGSTVWPWRLTQIDAIRLTWKPEASTALANLNGLVSTNACLGAVLDVDEPSYLLFGPPRLERRVTFLPRDQAPQAAERAGVPYVVIGSGAVSALVNGFKAGGWTLRVLALSSEANYWTLAISPRGGSGACHSDIAAKQAKSSGIS